MSKLKTLRSEKGWSLEKLAKKAKISKSVVKKAEDFQEIYASDWKSISTALKVPVKKIVVVQRGGLFVRERDRS